MPLKLK